MKTLLMLTVLGATLFGATLFGAISSAGGGDKKKNTPIRIGMIGLDTSHCTAFTSILNDPNAEDDLAGFRVVAAYPGGSPDIPASKDRIKGFTDTLRQKYGVEIVESIDEMLPKVDVVMIESVDGRPHLQQLGPVVKAGKKVFIDKPIAGSLADVLRIFALAGEKKVPVFSSSSLRYYPLIAAASTNPKTGKVLGCMTYGPCSLEEHHPDLFWYGIHGVEALYTIMGTGCKTVTRTHTKDTDVVAGVWADGRVGTFRGLRSGKAGYGALVFGSDGVAAVDGSGSYKPLVVEVCKFFRTGKAPVSAEETTELFAFMEAADESKRKDGAPVAIEAVLQKARAEIAAAK
jgi:predicted dehydrogenase